MEAITIEAIQKMTPAQLRDLRAQQGKPTTSRNRATLIAACIKAAMPRTPNGGGKAADHAPVAVAEVASAAPVKQRKPRAAPAPRTAKPAKQKSSARTEHTPESVGIGKVMRHGMRAAPYTGHVAECTAKKDGFHVEMVGPKGGRKDLGVHASLGAAARATGQNANGATFWRVKPYPKHAAK